MSSIAVVVAALAVAGCGGGSDEGDSLPASAEEAQSHVGDSGWDGVVRTYHDPRDAGRLCFETNWSSDAGKTITLCYARDDFSDVTCYGGEELIGGPASNWDFWDPSCDVPLNAIAEPAVEVINLGKTPKK